jgi:transmembrane sensor
VNAARLSTQITLEAARWHALQREGGLDRAQQARFMAWLVTSPAHLREYIAVGRVAGELGDAMQAMAIDVDALINHVPAGTASDNVVTLPLRRRAPPSALPAQPPRRWLPRAMAATVAMLAVGMMVHLAWPQSRHYTAAHGAPRNVQLPDRSVVHLNAESELTVRYTLFQRRVQLIRGQASFVVARGRRPFTVHAAGLQVRDIGTTFDVSLLREQARIGVAEGRVHILREDGTGRLLADLRAGQSARVDYRDHTVSISREDVDTMTGWWQRRIVFRDVPLREVADQFNRLNTVRVHVVDAGAGELRLTGNLRGDDVASLRAFLDDQPTLATTREGDRILVRTRAEKADHAARH